MDIVYVSEDHKFPLLTVTNGNVSDSQWKKTVTNSVAMATQ